MRLKTRNLKKNVYKTYTYVRQKIRETTSKICNKYYYFYTIQEVNIADVHCFFLIPWK